MYLISDETLHANKFTRSGTVAHISPTQFDAALTDVPGFVVYLMRVHGEVVKCGKAKGTTRGSTYKVRVSSEFNCIRAVGSCTVMAAGTWATACDNWHRHGVPAMRTPGTVVEVYTRVCATEAAMLEDETELNDFYRGRWQGQRVPSGRTPTRHRTTVSTLRLGGRQAAV